MERTKPYFMLDTENIELLGWTLDSIYPSNSRVFIKKSGKKNYELTFHGEAQKPSNQIVIYSVHYDIDDKRQTIDYFRGKCRDKFTLDLLMNLLEINIGG